jgi:hypothetical protein
MTDPGFPLAFRGRCTMRRIWMVAIFSLVLPVVATAQHRGGVAVAGPVAVAPRGVSGGAPHVVARVPAGAPQTTALVHRVRTAGTLNRNGSVASGLTNLPVFSADMNVPGLGFDYAHLAAVSPRHGRGRPGFGQNAPFGFGGFLLSSPEIVVENPQAVEEAQQVAPEEAANSVATDDGPGSQRQYFPRTNPAPEPPVDTSEYVFVRRDGGLLFAVAYSWENGTLRYVTRDGVRKSVTQDALDMGATQQFNEQRGLSFRVPA